MALVIVGDNLPSYEMAGLTYTDTQVSVIRGRNVEPGARVTLRRRGGTVTAPGSNFGMVELVSPAYAVQSKGGEVFLLLKRVGEKYEIIDTMPLEGGRPVSNGATYQVYLTYLKSLK